MAKLTLSFKGHLLSIHHLEERPAIIGRDPSCQITIDSLAVAPRHAELVPAETGFILLALDSEYPVLLNNERVDQASLNHGDQIQLGKHTLSFSEGSLKLAPQPAEQQAAPLADSTVEDHPEDEQVPAYLQVQSGPQIGRVVVFRRAVTRLSRVGVGDVVITRRGDDYHLSRLDGDEPVTIDGDPIESDAEVQLQHNSVICIGDKCFRFFSGKASVLEDIAEPA